jgi:YHS domain-containing protein
MIIVRLVALGILFYIALRLLRGIFGSSTDGKPGSRTRKKEAETRVQDVLVEDPVCHKLVPKNQAVRCRVQGKTYYFCSDACCDKFNGEQGKEE